MKNVFIVNSSITYNVTKQIISYKELSIESCVIFLTRDISFKTNIKTVDISSFSELFEIKLNFIKTRINLYKLDKVLSEQIDEEGFDLYIPHLGISIHEVISTHEKCNEISFFEEGMLAYRDYQNIVDIHHKANLSIVKDFINRLNFTGRKKRGAHYYPSEMLDKEFFCFSEHAFKFVKKKHVLKLGSEPVDYEINHLLILETIVEAYGIDVSVYLESIEKIILILKDKDIEEIHYKFHPGQKESKPFIVELFQKYKDTFLFTELPLELNIENAILSTQCDIYFTQSSVGLYGATNGNNLYSNLYDLRQSNPAMVEYVLEATPDFVKDRINYLN